MKVVVYVIIIQIQVFSLVLAAASFKCVCNPAGSYLNSTCNSTSDPSCHCKQFVTGRYCDECMNGYFNLQANNSDGCDACYCDVGGSSNSTCDKKTGTCRCKPNVIGKQCEDCLDPMKILRANGCQDCGCDPNGSLKIGYCDSKYSHICRCKKYVIGRYCDICKAGYFNLQENNPEGCETCKCNPMGSYSFICDGTSGMCQCKPNVIGWNCDACFDGYVLGPNGCEKKPENTNSSVVL